MINKNLNLTNPQNSIWYTEQFYKGTTINTICGTTIIDQKIDFSLLSEAVKIVYNKHDNFRLCIKTDEQGNIVQFLSEKKEIKIETISVENYEEMIIERDKIIKEPLCIENKLLFNFYIFKFKNGKGALMLNIHHLIADAWTLAFICNDIIKTYSALLKGEEPDTKAIYSYIDYINSEQDYIQSEKYQKDKSYWMDKFSSIPEVATIPGSLKKQDITNPVGNRIEFNLNAEIVNSIKSYCKANNISLFNFFMALYAIYISEISNLDDFVIGTPILNRTNFKEKNAAGMFVNIAPLRIDLHNRKDFNTFVKNISADSLNLLKHQKYSYQYLLEDLRHSNSKIPNLYNILLSYQITNTHMSGGDVNYKTEWTFNGYCAEDIDIQIHDINDTGALDISYDYKTCIYTEDDIKNIHLRILNIINQVVSSDNIALQDIEVITPDERKKLVEDFNKTDLEYNENIPIIQYFEKQAELTPNEIALVFEEREMTYKELNEKANSLAHLLRENNVTNNTIVGIMQERSFEMIIAILAVLKSGGSYIPIAPDYPAQRVEYMLQDSNAELLLTEMNNKIKTNKKIININLESDFYKYNKDNLLNISRPEDLSYLIYTSGSTGTPKGVMLNQKNLSNFYNAMSNCIKYFNDGKKHKIISITTVAFDIFIFETLMSLTKGLSVYMTNENEQKLTVRLEKIIKKNNIEIIQTTPSVMKFHLDNIEDSNDLRSLKYVILAGEPLPLQLVNRLKQLIPGVTIYNGYGPSETTVFSTITDVTNKSEITIGIPIANTQIYILNKNKKLIPQGTIGELYISGDGVGKGYMNKPEQTSNSFTENIFISEKRMYKVGDLGAFDEHGEITCYGRIDNQVKIRGLRIELDEIERKMLDIYGIKDVVVVKKTINEKDTLCAYYISNSPINEDAMRNYLQSKLPQYMVPQYFIKLTNMPYTPNGKVDRKLLPEPNQKEIKRDIVKPRNQIDEELSKIIKELLNIDELSMDNSLLDLGGDSLTAITLSTKISSKFDVQISIKDILSNNSIMEISDSIKQYKEGSKEVLKIKKYEDQENYPLSSAQRRIYYASKITGNSTLYNVSGGALINEVLKETKIKKAFNEMMKRHSSFRTIFKVIDNEPRQIVLEKSKIDIKFFKDGKVNEKTLVNKLPQPFDFEASPLFRIRIHFINNEKTLILIDSHHLVLDGISLEILIKEFCQLYNDEVLEENKISYKDYTLWENEFNQTPKFKELEEFWTSTFKQIDIPVISLPYDYPVSQDKTFNGDIVKKKISASLIKKIDKIASKNKVSSYVVLLSAFYALLYRYTSQNSIIVGSPISGRFNESLENMLGNFVNSIPLALTIKENTKFNNIIKDTNELVIKSLDMQPYPFDMLTKKLNNANLFDVMFTYQNENKQIHKIGNTPIDIMYANTKTAKYNLSMEIIPNIGIVKFEYNTSLFKKETISNMLEHYFFILEQIVNNDEIILDEIDMLTNKEKIMLDNFNNTVGEINEDTTADLIEKYAISTPNNVAVICEDKILTYYELNKKANSLANHLVKKGIKANDIVCIMTNRSLETIVAMVAILKAGAAFLNIDPTYPLDRTKYYIETSKAQYVLTQHCLKDTVKEIPNCIEIDLENNPIYESNFDKPKVKIGMRDLSYIIFTSGSTGQPKGVMLDQVGLTNMAKAMTKALDYLHDGKIHTLLSVTSTPFDIFVYEIIVSLTHGQRIVMANNAEHRNPKLLEILMKKYNTDVMTVTPSLMKIIYDNRTDNSAMAHVKNMVFGGEPLPEKFVKDLKALADDITVFNIYGPSEITVLSNVQNLDGETDITTGPPIMNTQIHILDKNMNRVPIGVVGEIYISGIQVGKGYIGRPDLTEEKFVINKFGEGRMYKSGDIGRWTFDGKVQCLGRIDHQIKLHGLRIELGEIESKIEQMPGISAAVVNKITLNDKDSLCAYYVTDGTLEVTEQEVKTHLKKYLPLYMIPSYIVHLDEMPYTINKKIDRKALPLPNISETKKRKINPEKYSDNEKKLLSIWKNILGINNISLDDNFFDIGGDSISAIKMQIEALKYDFSFEYADIFKHPTITELATMTNTSDVKENTELSNYDYSTINKVLSKNTLKNLETISKFNVKNILLIGSTGYLGIHILDEFLRNEKGIIYCLVRRRENEEPLARLHQKIIFYFGKEYLEKYKNRLYVIEGDIAKNNLALSENDYNLLSGTITTVINAGAIVKHFGLAEIFNEVNVEGTKNVIDFCKKTNKRLMHISTISVSGNGEKDENIVETAENINKKKIFKENTLFINQNISGIYAITKYKAEMLVLEAIADGLDAQILRMGNITNRYSDGAFQQNYHENAFTKRLKSFIELGLIPDYLLQHSLELGPVDLCAEAVLKILQHNSECNVFHIYNPKLLAVTTLLSALGELGINIKPVNDEEMSQKLVEILNDDSRKDILSGIIHDIDANKKLVYTSNVRINYNFTDTYLKNIGFEWKEIDKDYIFRYMNYFRRIGFINF